MKHGWRFELLLLQVIILLMLIWCRRHIHKATHTSFRAY
jgi:hypothetical protein